MPPHHHDEVEFDLPDKDDPSARNDLEYVAEYDDRTTRKQLSYLRTFAERTGQTFAYPRTIEQAAREIRRLKAVRPSARVERAIERREIADAIAQGAPNAASVDLERDVTGYGSTATWR
jgi:hypothetical protein